MRWPRQSHGLAAVAVVLVAGAVCWFVARRDAAAPPVADGPIVTKPEGEQFVPDELPNSWSLEEIAKAEFGDGTEGVYVLAWTVSGDPPLQYARSLVMKVLDEDDGYGRWCLAHVCRDPGVNNNGDWQLYMSHVLKWEEGSPPMGLWIWHSVRFKKRPTNAEVYAALDAIEGGVYWSFEPTYLVRGGVCERNWEKVIGEKPTKFFTEPKR